MDKDRVEGAVHQAKGSVKEAVGKVTGDKKLRPRASRKRLPVRCKTPLAARRMQQGMWLIARASSG